MARVAQGLVRMVLLAVIVSACGSGGDGGNPIRTIGKTSSGSGDGQSGAPGSLLGSALRVIVLEDGVPLEGVAVDWATASGGSLNPTTSTTDVDGVATSRWTLGPGSAAQTSTATLPGTASGTVTFTANGGVATINVINNDFNPDALTLPSGGGTVTWVWDASAIGHNVKPASTNVAAIPSSTGGQGALYNAPFQFSVLFTTSGTYRFHCFAHGAEGPPGTVTGMSGTVTVP